MIYYYCNGNEMLTVDVSINSYGICELYEQWQHGNEWNIIHRQNVKVEIPAPVASDLDVLLQLTYSEVLESGYMQDKVVIQTITIPQGQKLASKQILCYQDNQQDYSAGGITHYSISLEDIELIPQPALPEGCELEQPVLCNILISTVDTTPSRRGVCDGSIAVTLTNTSGNVTYKLNGHTYTTTGGNTFTFNNLCGGEYNIMVINGDCYKTKRVDLAEGDFRTGDFITNELPILSAAHNPIVFEIRTASTPVKETKDRNETVFQHWSGSGEVLELGTGLNAVAMFEVLNQTIADGTHIEFTFTNPKIYVKRFYAKGFPNKNNYFLATDTTNDAGVVMGSNDRSEIAQSIAECFNKDIFISQLYDIVVDNYKIYLSAKSAGDKYDLTTSNVKIYKKDGSTISTGISFQTLQKGHNEFDGSFIDNYSIYAELFVGEHIQTQFPIEGDRYRYTRVSEMVIPYQPDNSHRFDLSNALMNYVESNKPFYNFSGFATQPLMMRPYYIRYGEMYPIITNSNTTKKRYKGQTTTKWVINSAISLFTNNDMYSYFNGLRKFLTNSPNPKQIQRNQNEYLYMITEKNNPLQLKLFGDIYFYDNTKIDRHEFYTIQDGNDNAGGVIAMNLSYDKLGLDVMENAGSIKKKIKFLDVYLMVYNSPMDVWLMHTAKKRYSFNINEQPRKFGIIFQNRLGGYDTFDFVGVKETTYNREFGEYTVPLNPSLKGALEQGYKYNGIYNTKITKRIVANTGYLDKTHLTWLEELLNSNEIYDYTEDNQHYLRLIEHQYIHSSQEDIFDMEVTFEYTLYENGL